MSTISSKSWPDVTIYTSSRSGKPCLKWTPAPDATGYEIYRSEKKGDPFIRVWSQRSTVYTNKIAKPGHNYYYKIKALGNTPAFSSVVHITADCAMPSVSVAIREETGLPALTWDPVEGANKYEIHRAYSKDSSYTKICTISDTFHPIPMTTDKPVWYKVRALCAKSKFGDSHLSDAVCPVEELNLLTKTAKLTDETQKIDSLSFSEETYSAALPGDYKSYARSILLRYMHRHPSFTSVTTFPDYFQREMDIPDTYGFVKQLIRQGFLEMDGESSVALTQAGQNAINDNHIKFFEWSTPYVSYQDYSTEHTLLGERYSFEEIMSSILTKKEQMSYENDDISAIRDIALDIAFLYQAQGKEETALTYYLLSLYLDISGLEYHQTIRDYYNAKATRKDAESAFIGIAIRPAVISGVQALKDFFRPEMVHQIYLREPLDLQMCSEDLMLELITDLQNGPYAYGQWKKKFFVAYQAMLSTPSEEAEFDSEQDS